MLCAGHTLSLPSWSPWLSRDRAGWRILWGCTQVSGKACLRSSLTLFLQTCQWIYPWLQQHSIPCNNTVMVHTYSNRRAAPANSSLSPLPCLSLALVLQLLLDLYHPNIPCYFSNQWLFSSFSVESYCVFFSLLLFLNKLSWTFSFLFSSHSFLQRQFLVLSESCSHQSLLFATNKGQRRLSASINALL